MGAGFYLEAGGADLAGVGQGVLAAAVGNAAGVAVVLQRGGDGGAVGGCPVGVDLYDGVVGFASTFVANQVFRGFPLVITGFNGVFALGPDFEVGWVHHNRANLGIQRGACQLVGQDALIAHVAGDAVDGVDQQGFARFYEVAVDAVKLGGDIAFGLPFGEVGGVDAAGASRIGDVVASAHQHAVACQQPLIGADDFSAATQNIFIVWCSVAGFSHVHGGGFAVFEALAHHHDGAGRFADDEDVGVLEAGPVHCSDPDRAVVCSSFLLVYDTGDIRLAALGAQRFVCA